MVVDHQEPESRIGECEERRMGLLFGRTGCPGAPHLWVPINFIKHIIAASGELSELRGAADCPLLMMMMSRRRRKDDHFIRTRDVLILGRSSDPWGRDEERFGVH